jgi:DNA (cytosine-5)-methyltransferase 1
MKKYRFSQSKIVLYKDSISFVDVVSDVFDVSSPQIRWRDECPNNQENVLIRQISPDIFIASKLWRSFRFIDLFAGIGGIRLGFESVGGECVFTSEWDTEAQKTYKANFGECPAGDITKIETADIPDHDILLAGFPCQPFSIIGKQKGFTDTRGTLFFEIERILRDKKPTAFLLENVKQFRTHDNGQTCETVLRKLNELGYHTHVTVLNALDFGVAQKRERTFIAGFIEPLYFRFPESYGVQPCLGDILEAEINIDKKLFASEMICRKRLERLKEQGREPFYPSMWHENKGGHIGMHPFSCALRHNASYNYLLVNGNRRPTGREMLRFQGFPESYQIVVDHSAIRAQAGNAVAVPVITAIAAEMMIALRNRTIIKTVPTKQQLLFQPEEELIEWKSKNG